MTRVRRLSVIAAACCALGLVAGCDSGVPSRQASLRLAQQARVMVAREYWRAVASLGGHILNNSAENGKGYFDSCTGKPGNNASASVNYAILVLFGAPNRTESFPRLSAVVEQSLRRDGWRNFRPQASTDPVISSYLVGTRGQLRVSMGKPSQTSFPSDVITTFSGPCVRVSPGVANAVVDKTQAYNGNDAYPLAQVSAKPIPTKLP